MTITITEQYAQEQFQIIKSKCLEVVPPKYWKSIPETIAINHTRMTEFGTAFEEEKRVEFHHKFIGSQASEKLREVIAHELAHFCVGNDKHHNKTFKRYFAAFVYHLEIDEKLAEEQGELVVDKISFKWTVVAHLNNGEARNLGGVHRKTKALADYPRNEKESHVIKGTRLKVLRYEFIENNR